MALAMIETDVSQPANIGQSKMTRKEIDI